MPRCSHEQQEDPYASGNENRRRNRDRINDQIEMHNILRHGAPRGYGPPLGRPQHIHSYDPRIPLIFPPFMSPSGSRFSRPLRPSERVHRLFGPGGYPLWPPELYGLPRLVPFFPSQPSNHDEDLDDSDDEDNWIAAWLERILSGVHSPWDSSAMRHGGRSPSGSPLGGYYMDYDSREDGGYLNMPRPLHHGMGCRH
jgi:hypothetical protein